MVKKEFTFKGKTLPELKNMSIEEFAKLTGTRARRSLLRGQDKPLHKAIDKYLKAKEEGKHPKPIRTHKRDTIIIPKMIGIQFSVYQGKSFEFVEIQPEMLGHYLGEFALTRKIVKHGKAGIGATKSSSAIGRK